MATQLNIVVVEDNNDLRTLISTALRKDGHRVTALSCAEELEDQAGSEHADAFLIDINLPGEDGLSLSNRIRKAHPLVGIIMVSARSALDNKLEGYDCGADLYLTKPVSLPELSAALRSFGRRRLATLKHINATGLTLNKLELQGKESLVRLTAQEAIVLTALSRAPAGRLETWQIADLLHTEVDEAFRSSLAVRMVRLRKKLTDAGAEGTAIESLRNIGYQLTTHIEII